MSHKKPKNNQEDKQENTAKNNDTPPRKKRRWWVYVLWGLLAVVILIFLESLYKSYRIYSMTSQSAIAKIEEYREAGQIIKAMEILTYRNASRDSDSGEIDEITRFLIDHAPRLEPIFYMALAQRFERLEDRDEAVFWLMLGTMRMMYDHMRCGRGAGIDGESFHFIVQLLSSTNLRDYLSKNPALQIETAQAVLAWDEANPPETEADYLCNMRRLPFQSRVRAQYRGYDYEFRRMARMELHGLIGLVKENLHRTESEQNLMTDENQHDE